MIIAVDYDGTLCIGGKANTALIGRLTAAQRQGSVVILWTCREGESLREAVRFLHQHGFSPNLVNQNHPTAIRMLGHDSRKIWADVYIEDKGANP